QALLERAEEPIALLANRGAVDGAARRLEREDADLESREGELLAVAGFSAFREGGDGLGVGDREVQIDRLDEARRFRGNRGRELHVHGAASGWVTLDPP